MPQIENLPYPVGSDAPHRIGSSWLHPSKHKGTEPKILQVLHQGTRADIVQVIKSSTIWSRNYPRELQNNIHAQLTQNLLKTSSPTYYCESKTLKFHLISHRTPYIFHRLLEILSVPLKILLILSRATFLLKTPTLTGSLRELFLLLSTKFYRETRGHITLCIR